MTKGQLRVYNIAMAMIGNKPIASVLAEGPHVDACNQMFPEALESVLSEHEWNCAVRRATLTASSEVPAFGFSNKIQKPVDCAAVWEIVGLDEDDYEIESNWILCNQETIQIRYTTTDVPAENLSQWVRQLVAIRLAYFISPYIKASISEISVLEQIYQGALYKARMIDGKENAPRVKAETTWINQYGG